MQKTTNFKFNANYKMCLENESVKLIPLQQHHFDSLFAIASDPLIWEQHPNPNRYKLADFTNFFNGAIASDNAFLIVEKVTNEVMGSRVFMILTQKKNRFISDILFLVEIFGAKDLINK